MLTSKDFKKAAKALNRFRSVSAAVGMDTLPAKIATAILAEIFEASNPKFNKDKFYKACNLEP